ncbi:MAG: sulfatase [Opitutia bacterium]
MRLLLLLLAALPLCARQPNIVLIMADDLGWTDLGCFGSKYYETPALDRLAAEGMRLTNHHHCQNCTPTRAALLSGQYGARTGVYTVGGIGRFDWSKRPLRPVDNVTALPLDRDTFADQLKKAGYATGMFGKWHIGEGGDHHPSKRGFDEALVSMGEHFDFKVNPRTEYPKGAYLADWLTDRAVDFIGRHKDRPFLLYLPHFGVHAPFHAKKELVARFKDKPGVGGHDDPTYAAMIASVDESVGRILAKLKEVGVDGDTVVVFVSDNGGVGGYGRPDGLIREPGRAAKATTKGDAPGEDGKGVTDNAPRRTGQGSLYEGGTRVPVIVSWPGRTKAGSSADVPTAHVDIFPTLLELAGAPKPRQPLDGASLAGLFKDPAAGLGREAIFQHFPGYLGAGAGLWRTTPVSLIHAGDWKLMEYLEDGKLELYNLKDDLGETKNLAGTMPDKAKELHAKLIAWRKEVNAPMPARNDQAGEGGSAKKGKGKKKQGG